MPPPLLLDDNLLMEILSWLPLKPLKQVRCVCKFWNSLITSPQFAKLRQQRSADICLMFGYPDNDSGQYSASSCSVSSFLENHSRIVAASRHEPQLRPLNKKYLFAEYRFIGTCYGLISLLNVLYDLLDQKYCYRISLWNPTLNSISQEWQPLYSVEKRTFGFGYDYFSNTFKVVAVNGTQMMEVYNMGGNSWRSIKSSYAFPNTQQEQDGVYLSGTLNWVGLRDIVSFNLGKENWAQLSLPRCRNSFDITTLGILRDCLCVFYYSSNQHLVIWQMKKFRVHDSWTQIMKFDYTRSSFPLYKALVPLFMSDNDDVVLLSEAQVAVLFIFNEGQERLQWKEIPKHKKFVRVKSVKAYSESLVRPC